MRKARAQIVSTQKVLGVQTGSLTEPAAVDASNLPANLSCRMSKHSSRPSSPAAATKPCEGEMPNLLMPGECELKDS